MLLELHPYVAAYLKQGFPSLHTKWQWQYKCRLKLLPSMDCSMLQVRWMDKNSERIDITEGEAV